MKLALPKSTHFLFFASLVAAVSVRAVSLGQHRAELAPRAGTLSSNGTHDGYYYMYWTDQLSTAYYTNEEGGSYRLEWSGGQGNLLGGKGWNPGKRDRVINYNATVEITGNGYLSVYGWLRNPSIEYYIMDFYGTYDPSANPNGSTAKVHGMIACNGSKYRVVSDWYVGWWPEDTFLRIWSVRDPKRDGSSISGTIDVACHFDAWKGYGLKLGSEHEYQLVATEGYYSNGATRVTVSGS